MVHAHRLRLQPFFRVARSRTRAKTGGKGIRTPGLLIANETLYQLSYTPILPMKNGARIRPKNNVCPAVLSGIHSGSNENTSEHECIPESGRMSVPLFIERRLLCALRERRQGNPPLAAHDGPSISATRARLVTTRARASRSVARQAHAR